MKLCLFFLLIFTLEANDYSATSSAIAESKKSACKKALQNAKQEALAEAGTLIISHFSSSKTVKDDNYNSTVKDELQAISVGIVKVISKQEKIEVTKNYQFQCSVKAVFSINENDMKKAIDKYLTKNKKEQNKNIIYIKAKGYSEEGQSRYKAIKSATLDAKRNLLDEIKGSELISSVELEDGKLQADKIINMAKGSIRFVKIISSKYDGKTKSAIVIVGMTKENLTKNINIWKDGY